MLVGCVEKVGKRQKKQTTVYLARVSRGKTQLLRLGVGLAQDARLKVLLLISCTDLRKSPPIGEHSTQDRRNVEWTRRTGVRIGFQS